MARGRMAAGRRPRSAVVSQWRPGEVAGCIAIAASITVTITIVVVVLLIVAAIK